MQLELGQKIRELRHRDGRTQEALADALGVTSQAISRWEANGGYPDMEMIPAIANYFGVSIDELFGYENDRERKIGTIIEKIDSFGIKSRGDDGWVDECVSILREGLAEFPGNERLLITLAETLSEAGWRRHKEWVYYDEEGYMRHNYDVHRENTYWNESVKICEQLVSSTTDSTISMRATTILVLLNRNFGENEKARAYAQRMPEMKYCRELMLASASDGKEEAKYIGEFLLKSACEFAEQFVYGLIVNKHNYDSDMPINKIKGLISLFDLICDDGNFGKYNDMLIKLYLYLSRIQWERGYHDEAFESLDKALYHAKELERLIGKSVHRYTAPLISFVVDSPAPTPGLFADVARELPDDWPFWCNPDFSEVEKEIKTDPRWDEWVKKTKE
ncbi:MAG: helix-turn-helix transcriptional regulator [Clostridia bacterium]|nr:helix-turn-helix transcriptional regulator [Clostridia bacterium]